MSLPDEFTKDLTASHRDAGIMWVASNDIAAAFRISPDTVWRPANADAQPKLISPAVKRALDLAIAVPALVLLAPFLALIALIILLDSGGPVFFRQMRLGRDGKPFDIFKFRTMRVMENGDTVIQARHGDARITRSGIWLRRTSIDELPQLLNVIAGEMSIVGPRPHARAHDLFYSTVVENYDLRQAVKPGITGWAQINGHRGETPTFAAMQARVDHDIWYARHASLALDLKILARTPFAVLSGRNAY
ncbi:MAG: exopolysaccharide biosynthesis polyprenyl glycosylphosphotransferase [Rhizomicrobium sp.]